MRDILQIWIMASWPIVLTVAPLVYFSRRRVTWRWWEAAALIIPYVVWLSLDAYVGLPKSLANLGEYAVIVVGIPIATLIRIIAAPRLPQLPTAAILQVALVGAIVLKYFTTPMLPE